MSKTLILLFILFPDVWAKDVKIIVEKKIIAEVDEKFLSFGIDTAQVVGSYWWDAEGKMSGGRGKNKTSPLNLRNSKLIAYAKELAPAYFRIGGSEADALFYNLKNENKNHPPEFDSILLKSHFEKIKFFINQTNLKLFFTLNQGPATWKNGKWQTENLEHFLKFYTANQDIPITFELGNEVFAYWAIFGLDFWINEKEYAKNYLRTKKLFKKYNIPSKLAGPASAYWPIIGEPLGFIFNKMEDLFPILNSQYDIVSWHFYPTQSFRCPLAVRRMNKERLLDLDTLNEIKKWAKEVKDLRNKFSPEAKLWLGETGSAQCGGEPGISDRFISSLWWLDQLGILATFDHDVVIRHNFIEADYALLNNNLSPRPDYYASWLWKKHMGTGVLSATSTDKKVRVYTHCHPEKGETILLINLDRSEKTLHFTHDLNYIQMSSKDIFSREVVGNNKIIQNLDQLKSINWIRTKNRSLKIEKHSYVFARNLTPSSTCNIKYRTN